MVINSQLHSSQSSSKSKMAPSVVDPPLIPLPLTPHPSPENPQNGGNTCYLDTVLVSLFAEQDISDSLLSHKAPSAPLETLCKALRIAVNALRRGEVITSSLIRDVRQALVKLGWHPGSSQQDAAELYAFLLDQLGAPFVPLFNNLSHRGVPDVGDYALGTERVIWLNLNPDALKSNLSAMLDDYFFGQVMTGLRRGSGNGVDAKITKSLIPFYTPNRETGETVNVRRGNFRYLTLPLAVNRFAMGGGRKDRSFVDVPTVISATGYVGRFGGGDVAYTLILRSVVCHCGWSIGSGHYVCYTLDPRIGWRRWNDLDDRKVETTRGDVGFGMPENENWRMEIGKDCYLLFYELVPGDGEAEMRGERGVDIQQQVKADEQFAKQRQVEEDHLSAMRDYLATGGDGMIGGDPIRPFAFWPTE